MGHRSEKAKAILALLFSMGAKTPEMPTVFGNHGKLHPLRMISYAGLAELVPPILKISMQF
jgi:hypothetical protein